MTDGNLVEGKKQLIDYFGASWNTIKKRLKHINDTNIVYKNFAGKWILVRDAYEKKYGCPQKLPVSA